MHTKTPYTGDMQALVDCAPPTAVPLRVVLSGVVSHLTVVRIPVGERVKPMRVSGLFSEGAAPSVLPRCIAVQKES